MKDKTKDELLKAYEEAFSAIIGIPDPSMDGTFRFHASNGGRQNRAFRKLCEVQAKARKENGE